MVGFGTFEVKHFNFKRITMITNPCQGARDMSISDKQT